MNDTRLNQVAALVDAARCLLADMADEGVLAEDRIALNGICSSLNEALRRTKNLKDGPR